TTLALLGFLAGVAVLVQRERRRRAFDLPRESPMLLGAKAAAMALVCAFVLVVYADGMPAPVLFAVLVAAAGAVLLRKTRLGRYGFAIGGNAEAARLSGVPVARTTILIYVLTGMLTALAGIVAAARTNGVSPGNMGLTRELHVVTAVVIGGTSLLGGRA